MVSGRVCGGAKVLRSDYREEFVWTRPIIAITIDDATFMRLPDRFQSRRLNLAVTADDRKTQAQGCRTDDAVGQVGHLVSRHAAHSLSHMPVEGHVYQHSIGSIEFCRQTRFIRCLLSESRPTFQGGLCQCLQPRELYPDQHTNPAVTSAVVVGAYRAQSLALSTQSSGSFPVVVVAGPEKRLVPE